MLQAFKQCAECGIHYCVTDLNKIIFVQSAFYDGGKVHTGEHSKSTSSLQITIHDALLLITSEIWMHKLIVLFRVCSVLAIVLRC